MAGSRRTQRSVRVSVAAVVLTVAALLVVAALVASTWVAGAAVLALVAGALAARIVYSEVLQTRRDSARTCAEQAHSFQQAMSSSHRERLAFGELMAGRLLERDLTVSRLTDGLRSAERRAVDAESRADESRRQLGRLLDEVFGTVIVDEDFDSGLATQLSASG